MSPTLNRRAVQRFEGNDAIEIRNGITFDFYTGLPHMCMYVFILFISYNDIYLCQTSIGMDSWHMCAGIEQSTNHISLKIWSIASTLSNAGN